MTKLDLTGSETPLTLSWLQDEVATCERVSGQRPERVILTEAQTQELCRRLARQQVKQVTFATPGRSVSVGVEVAA